MTRETVEHTRPHEVAIVWASVCPGLDVAGWWRAAQVGARLETSRSGWAAPSRWSDARLPRDVVGAGCLVSMGSLTRRLVVVRRRLWPKIFESFRELPAKDALIDVVEPARLDTVEGDRCEIIEVEPLRLGHAAVLLAEVEVGHPRVIGIERGEQSRLAHRPEGVLAEAREPIGDDHVAVGADCQWDAVGRHASDERRVLHDRDRMVDTLQPKHVEADQDVLGSHADRLAGVTGTAEPVTSREFERLCEGRQGPPPPP